MSMIGLYGSILRYKSIERLKPIGKYSVLGASGGISDFQQILRYLDELMVFSSDGGSSLASSADDNSSHGIKLDENEVW
ncbi:hypothetical protein HN873_004993 [Arachis hypogaea]